MPQSHDKNVTRKKIHICGRQQARCTPDPVCPGLRLSPDSTATAESIESQPGQINPKNHQDIITVHHIFVRRKDRQQTEWVSNYIVMKDRHNIITKPDTLAPQWNSQPVILQQVPGDILQPVRIKLQRLIML